MSFKRVPRKTRNQVSMISTAPAMAMGVTVTGTKASKHRYPRGFVVIKPDLLKQLGLKPDDLIQVLPGYDEHAGKLRLRKGTEADYDVKIVWFGGTKTNPFEFRISSASIPLPPGQTTSRPREAVEWVQDGDTIEVTMPWMPSPDFGLAPL